MIMAPKEEYKGLEAINGWFYLARRVRNSLSEER